MRTSISKYARVHVYTHVCQSSCIHGRAYSIMRVNMHECIHVGAYSNVYIHKYARAVAFIDARTLYVVQCYV